MVIIKKQSLFKSFNVSPEILRHASVDVPLALVGPDHERPIGVISKSATDATDDVWLLGSHRFVSLLLEFEESVVIAASPISIDLQVANVETREVLEGGPVLVTILEQLDVLPWAPVRNGILNKGCFTIRHFRQ